MIQRIQSILMLGIVVALIVLFFVPIFQINSTGINITQGVCVTKIDATLTTSSQINYFSLLLAVLPIVVTLFSIFQYKNRPLQLKLGLVNTVLLLSLLGAMIYYKSNVVSDNSLILKVATAKFGFGFFIPAICLILNMISIRFIRRDERMVKDAFERLR